MTFNDSIEYILKNPDVLKSPIILAKKKLLVGYDSEKIRMFIPQKKRREILSNNY